MTMLYQEGRFCYHHVDQKFGRNTRSENTDILGITKNGLECKRCIIQEKLCYQHTYQDPAILAPRMMS